MKPAIAIKDFKHTLYEVQNHIATVTLNRPERHNALNPIAYGELEAAFRHIQLDGEVRVAIVTGSDPSFCSGEDVVEMMTGDGPQKSKTSTAATIKHKMTPAASAILACDRPIIAAINGAAVGWGMELALFADIRIASERAKFAELFIKRGLIADIGGLLRLPAIVGPAKAAELLYSGDRILADEAERIGLVSKVVPHEELMTAAQDMAKRFACNAPLALRTMKEGLKLTSFGDPEEMGSWAIENIYKLMKTEDHKEGVRSFLEKREAEFKGR